MKLITEVKNKGINFYTLGVKVIKIAYCWKLDIITMNNDQYAVFKLIWLTCMRYFLLIYWGENKTEEN